MYGGNMTNRCSHADRTASSGSALAELDQHLARVLAAQQADERRRRALEAVDHRLAVVDAPLAQPRPHLLREVAHPVAVVAHDEPAQRQALADGLPEVARRARRLGGV